MFDYLLDAQSQGLLGQEHYGQGRGIVFTAGNSDTFERVRSRLFFFEYFTCVR